MLIEKGKFDVRKALIVTVPPLLESCPHDWYSIKPLFIGYDRALLSGALDTLGVLSCLTVKWYVTAARGINGGSPKCSSQINKVRYKQ